MELLPSHTPKSRIIILILIFAGLLPALFINLGLIPLKSDEPTRTVVAIEMDLSGNYVAPTINGEPYYNKPPLFNWILIGIAKIAGGYTAFNMRLPSVIFLLLTGLIIFLYSRKHFPDSFSVTNALLFITCGQIFFWDSWNALIDISFSFIIFLNFMIIFELGRKDKWLQMFLLSYFLCAAAYMMKALPALVFQGISLLVYTIAFKKFKKIFSLAHLAGIGLLTIVLGSYYFALSRYYPIEDVFNRLLFESTTRTAVENGLWPTIQHIFTFPLDFIMDFLPWTLLIVFFFRRGALQQIKQTPFLKYSFLIFIFNIPVYWISPDIRARYLFMLLPLFFTVVAYIYYSSYGKNFILRRITDSVFFVILIAASITLLILPFVDAASSMTNIKPVGISLGIAGLLIAFFFLKIKTERLLLIVLFLVLGRIAFNLTSLPDRYEKSHHTAYYHQTMEVARITHGKELKIFEHTLMNHDNSFYLARERNEILRREYDEHHAGVYYLCDKNHIDIIEIRGLAYEIFYTFEFRLGNTKIYLIQLNI